MHHRFIKIWGIGEPVMIRSDIRVNSLPQTEKYIHKQKGFMNNGYASRVGSKELVHNAQYGLVSSGSAFSRL